MIIGKGIMSHIIGFNLLIDLLLPEQCFIKRKYVWIPFQKIAQTHIWLCLRVREHNDELVYRTIIAFNVSNKKDYSYVRVYLSVLEIFEIVFLDDRISNFFNKIVEKC